jgi:hypothetical protein
LFWKPLPVNQPLSQVPGRAKEPLRSAIAQCVKELIWRFAVRLTPRRRPICLYASRRSGSTLLMEMIAVNPGVMFSDQPFGIYTASSANLNRLPIFASGQIAGPDADEQRYLRQYIQGLLSGRIKANVPWKMWSPEFHFRNDRVCLKITDAKSVIDWIASGFDVHTVVLTRHPIAQALSVARMGWFSTGKGLLRNRAYVQRWLNDDLEAYCWNEYHVANDLTRRTLDWALENLPMLRQLPDHPDWLFVSYEDLVAHTRATVRHLADQLDLPAVEQMIQRVGRPSRSTHRESSPERRRLIAQQNRDGLLDSWRSQVDPDELQRCFAVLDRLGIDLYRPHNSMPNHRSVGRQPIGESRHARAELASERNV